MLGVARVEAGVVSERGEFLAVLLVAEHGAVAEAERKGCVGRARRPLNGEARFFDKAVRLFLGFVGGFPFLSQCAGRRVDEPREFDQGILGGGDGSGSAFVELFAERDIAHLGAVDQLDGALAR